MDSSNEGRFVCRLSGRWLRCCRCCIAMGWCSVLGCSALVNWKSLLVIICKIWHWHMRDSLNCGNWWWNRRYWVRCLLRRHLGGLWWRCWCHLGWSSRRRWNSYLYWGWGQGTRVSDSSRNCHLICRCQKTIILVWFYRWWPIQSNIHVSRVTWFWR